jgi:D-arabinose 1-dehydrogenase-like Zn-dependent alcohol dehydrogenase
MGFKTVSLSSSGDKEKLARSLGATEYIDGSKVNQGEALKAMGGAKLILCTAPHGDIITGLIDGLATNGTLLLLACKLEIPSDSTIFSASLTPPPPPQTPFP